MLEQQQARSIRFHSPHPSKTYTIGRFLSDVRWLVSHVGELVGAYLGDEIDPQIREEVLTAVSFENACRWCSFMHSEWAMELGVDSEELEHIERLNPSGVPFERWAAALFARHRAAQGFGPMPADFEAEASELFGERHRDLIEALARMISVANGVSNTFDAFLARLDGKPLPGSRLRDELFFSALFAAAAPWAAIALAVMRGEGPLELREKFADFSRRFEDLLRRGRMAFAGA
jgi:AhpD family alkylhydroperoxidase